MFNAWNADSNNPSFALGIVWENILKKWKTKGRILRGEVIKLLLFNYKIKINLQRIFLQIKNIIKNS